LVHLFSTYNWTIVSEFRGFHSLLVLFVLTVTPRLRRKLSTGCGVTTPGFRNSPHERFAKLDSISRRTEKFSRSKVSIPFEKSNCPDFLECQASMVFSADNRPLGKRAIKDGRCAIGLYVDETVVFPAEKCQFSWRRFSFILLFRDIVEHFVQNVPSL
jgi:hypothetical protein